MRIRHAHRAAFAATALVGALGIAGGSGAFAPAQALPVGVGGAECFVGAPAARATGRIDDTRDLGPAAQARLELIAERAANSVEKRDRARSRTQAETQAAQPVRVPVRVHVLKGTHRADAFASRTRVNTLIRRLNAAYAGGQSTTNTRTPFSFYVRTFDTTRKDSWYHANVANTTRDNEMRRRLHEGGADSLNLYLNKPDRVGRDAVLGWASYPYSYQSYPRLDGVTLDVRTLPGGAYSQYNEGDTAVHEVGHWLGLLHTFDDGFGQYVDGCNPENDWVEDTPQEAQPAEGCPPNSRDTCSAPGTDPIHNFMDYAYDSCMWEFTPGQVALMSDAWSSYRAP